MSRRGVALAALGIAVLAGCAAPAPAPVAAPPTSNTVPSPTGEPAAPDPSALVSCLTAAAPGDTVTQLPDAPPGGTAAVAVDVPRPDLPKGTNRITVATFSDASAASTFADGSGTFVSGTGGTAAAVGAAVVYSTYAGDDAVVTAARSCAAAAS